MKEYNVVFHYSVRVEADDEDEAEDMAWSEFGVVRYSRTASSEFACTVEEIEVESQVMKTQLLITIEHDEESSVDGLINYTINPMVHDINSDTPDNYSITVERLDNTEGLKS